MSFLSLKLESGQSLPLSAGSTVTLSFPYVPSYTYNMFWNGGSKAGITASAGTSIATWTSPALDATTTFFLEVVENTKITTQYSLTVPFASSGRKLLQTVSVTANTTWASLTLPPAYTHFQLLVQDLHPTTSSSVPIAQLLTSLGAITNNAGTGWGNDIGGNGFFEYSIGTTSYLLLWANGRSGPVAGSGVFGTVNILNSTPTSGNGFVPVTARLYAPTAYNSNPAMCNVGSHAVATPGASITEIQIGFGFFSPGSAPNNLDTMTSGQIELYGWT